MSTLPAPAVTALEEAREWAAHADALASLEECGWRFARSDEGVFVAEQKSRRGDVRCYDADLARLVARCTPKRTEP